MRATPLLLTLALTLAATTPLEAQRVYEAPNKEAHRQRRANFLEAMDGGIAIIVAAQKDQDLIYEFFVDHSDLHDFIYLTGLDGIDAWESALVLAPDAETYREILYTSQDPDGIQEKTGMDGAARDPGLFWALGEVDGRHATGAEFVLDGVAVGEGGRVPGGERTWDDKIPSSGASSPFERRSRPSSKHQGPRESPLRPWTHQVECDILGKHERKFLSRAQSSCPPSPSPPRTG